MPIDQRRLEDAITILVSHRPKGLSRTALVKLLYFLDLRSWEKDNRPITGLSWYWHYFGPYADEITDTVSDLEIHGELAVDVHPSGFGSTEYRIHLGAHPGLYGVLTDDERRTLMDVQLDFSRYSPTQLSKLSYQTFPLQAARQRGEQLDFAPYRSGNRTHPPRFVPNPSAAPSPKMSSQWTPGAIA